MTEIEDQETPQEGWDGITPDRRDDEMAEAIGEMIAVSAAWIDIEDGMRGGMA